MWSYLSYSFTVIFICLVLCLRLCLCNSYVNFHCEKDIIFENLVLYVTPVILVFYLHQFIFMSFYLIEIIKLNSWFHIHVLKGSFLRHTVRSKIQYCLSKQCKFFQVFSAFSIEFSGWTTLATHNVMYRAKNMHFRFFRKHVSDIPRGVADKHGYATIMLPPTLL